jgi:hypothetical protein
LTSFGVSLQFQKLAALDMNTLGFHAWHKLKSSSKTISCQFIVKQTTHYMMTEFSLARDITFCFLLLVFNFENKTFHKFHEHNSTPLFHNRFIIWLPNLICKQWQQVKLQSRWVSSTISLIFIGETFTKLLGYSLEVIYRGFSLKQNIWNNNS